MVGFQSHLAVPYGPSAYAWLKQGFADFILKFEHLVVTFGVGIALYFTWPAEPSVWFPLIAIGTLALLLLLEGVGRLLVPVTLLLIATFGFGWATVSTKLMQTHPVPFEQKLTISGWVAEIDQGGPMRRLIINLDAVDPTPEAGLPKSVRVRVGKNFPDVEIGEGVTLDAVISPLPGPAVPDGYDPARRAFFDGLGGSGFAISDPRPFRPTLFAWDRAKIHIQKTRQAAARRVLSQSPPSTAGLQVALLTGIRDYIPEEQTDSLRASGLAHILAISGLHMGMVAVGIYALSSLILAAVEPLSRARDVRKIAAIIGILGATLYLLLSGASVATQRAYIMVCIAFLAVLLDRRILSLRSVAVAALITLIIRPEALLSVGFQMSFAAVTAMVVIFRAWQDFRPPRKADGIGGRLKRFYGSLFGTSLIAGLATGGYAVLHFGRIAQYGLLANMLAMAVFPIVMALGILSLILIPLGWETLPLMAMGKAIEFMLLVADWVSGLPGAVGTVKASPPEVIALYSLGFVCACFGTLRSVSVGVPLMLISFLLWMQAPTYDLRVSETGRVSLLVGNEGQTASLRADRYGREQFARASGHETVEWHNYRDQFASCDALACRMEIMDRVISVVETASEAPEACQDSDVVILPEREAGPVARRGCQALLIDQRVLKDRGTIYLQLGDALRLVPVLTDRRSNRPWGVKRT